MAPMKNIPRFIPPYTGGETLAALFSREGGGGEGAAREFARRFAGFIGGIGLDS